MSDEFFNSYELLVMSYEFSIISLFSINLINSNF